VPDAAAFSQQVLLAAIGEQCWQSYAGCVKITLLHGGPHHCISQRALCHCSYRRTFIENAKNRFRSNVGTSRIIGCLQDSLSLPAPCIAQTNTTGSTTQLPYDNLTITKPAKDSTCSDTSTALLLEGTSDGLGAVSVVRKRQSSAVRQTHKAVALRGHCSNGRTSTMQNHSRSTKMHETVSSLLDEFFVPDMAHLPTSFASTPSSCNPHHNAPASTWLQQHS